MIKFPYALVMGSLMYVMICTRPTIAYAIGIVTKSLSNLKKEHCNAVKWGFETCLMHFQFIIVFWSENPLLASYTNASMTRDIGSRKSTSSYLISFVREVMSWQSNLQKCVVFVLSTQPIFFPLSLGDFYFLEC